MSARAGVPARDDVLVGLVVMLNGVPRSGKSSIAAELVASDPAAWTNLGVDETMADTPADGQPGVGLRPGDDHPELRAALPALFDGLWERVDAMADRTNVVVDVGLYDVDLRRRCVHALRRHRLVWVRVWCPIETALERRRQSPGYVAAPIDSDAAAPIRAWHDAVYALPVAYDLAFDTTSDPPSVLAATISAFVVNG